MVCVKIVFSSFNRSCIGWKLVTGQMIIWHIKMTSNCIKCSGENVIKIHNDMLTPEFKLYRLHHSALIILLNVYYAYCIHISKHCMSFN